MNLIDQIEDHMLADDDDREDQSERLLRVYANASPEARKALDDAIVCICGYSIKTMVGTLGVKLDDFKNESQPVVKIPYLLVMEDGEPDLIRYDSAQDRTEHLRKQDPDGNRDFYAIDADGEIEFVDTLVGADE